MKKAKPSLYIVGSDRLTLRRMHNFVHINTSLVSACMRWLSCFYAHPLIPEPRHTGLTLSGHWVAIGGNSEDVAFRSGEYAPRPGTCSQHSAMISGPSVLQRTLRDCADSTQASGFGSSLWLQRKHIASSIRGFRVLTTNLRRLGHHFFPCRCSHISVNDVHVAYSVACNPWV